MKVSTVNSDAPSPGRPPWPGDPTRIPQRLEQTHSSTRSGCGLLTTISFLLEGETLGVGLGLTHLPAGCLVPLNTEQSLQLPQRKNHKQKLVPAQGHSALLSLPFPRLTPTHCGHAVHRLNWYLLGAYSVPSTALATEDTTWMKQKPQNSCGLLLIRKVIIPERWNI